MDRMWRETKELDIIVNNIPTKFECDMRAMIKMLYQSTAIIISPAITRVGKDSLQVVGSGIPAHIVCGAFVNNKGGINIPVLQHKHLKCSCYGTDSKTSGIQAIPFLAHFDNLC